MAIIIKHTYSTEVDIVFTSEDGYCFHQKVTDTMDGIAEHVCEMFAAHRFTAADVCDARTGEVLMILERT